MNSQRQRIEDSFEESFKVCYEKCLSPSARFQATNQERVCLESCVKSWVSLNNFLF